MKGAPGGSAGLYAKLVAMAALWGGVFVAGRMVALETPPLTTAALRFVIALAVLLPLVYAWEGALPRLDRRQLGIMCLLGLTGVAVFSGFFFAGLERVPAGRGALIMALNPVGTALAMALVLHERLAASRWLGIAAALAGVAVVISRGDLGTFGSGALGAGELMFFGSVAGWVTYTIIGRNVLGQVSALATTTYAALFGTAILVVGALFEAGWRAIAAFDAGAWVAVAYLGSFGTVLPFVFFNEGVRRIGPSRTAIFINFVPVFGVAFSALLLGEPILSSMIIGGLMVIGGVLLTTRPASAAARTPRPAR
jgi:drug/metabolite transporter (DMT)-like permease